jgi:phospholipid/cholesterol/gamma-HCH transport system substrate-binding protein
VIKNQLRPFTTIARPTVTELRRRPPICAVTTRTCAAPSASSTRCSTCFAYNPPGKEEGFLFWQTWLNHAGATIFNTQDAHGPIRRGLVIVSCGALGVLENIKRERRSWRS